MFLLGRCCLVDADGYNSQSTSSIYGVYVVNATMSQPEIPGRNCDNNKYFCLAFLCSEFVHSSAKCHVDMYTGCFFAGAKHSLDEREQFGSKISYRSMKFRNCENSVFSFFEGNEFNGTTKNFSFDVSCLETYGFKNGIKSIKIRLCD